MNSPARCGRTDYQLVGKCDACLGANGVYFKSPLLLFPEYSSNTFYLKKLHMSLAYIKNESKKSNHYISSRLGVKTGWYRNFLLNFHLPPIKNSSLCCNEI